MKPRILAAFAILLISTSSLVAASLQANLKGSSETDPDGQGHIVITTTDNGLAYTLTWAGIDPPTAAHIHRGSQGEMGPVVLGLSPVFDHSSTSGFIEASPALIDEISGSSGNFYVNVHNETFSDGAIRGQINPMIIDEDSFTVVMSGAAELAPYGDPDGTGIAIITLNGLTLQYTIQTDRIANPTAAHIHQGSALEDGAVIVDLEATFAGGVAQSSVQIDEATREAMLAHPEDFYLNVHNVDYPDGALRAQLSSEWVLPVSGKVGGANDTNYVTDVRILNQTTASARVRIDFFAQSTTGSETPAASRIVTVPALSQIILNDVAGRLFGRSGLGAMTFVSDRQMRVTGRVINDLREFGQGTNGLFINALPMRDASLEGSFPFLSSSTADQIGAGLGFRTNIGFFNPADEAVNLTVSLHRSSDGVYIGDATVTAGPHQHLQGGIFDLVNEVPASERGIEDFFARWSSTGPMFVYVSVTDNATGDAMVLVD